MALVVHQRTTELGHHGGWVGSIHTVGEDGVRGVAGHDAVKVAARTAAGGDRRFTNSQGTLWVRLIIQQ